MNNNYLIGKQEYPANVLAAKRLMTDFNYSNISKPTSAGKQQEQVEPTYVAFTEKRKMGWRSHMLLLQRKTRRRVAGVPKGIEQGEVEDRRHVRLRAF